MGLIFNVHHDWHISIVIISSSYYVSLLWEADAFILKKDHHSSFPMFFFLLKTPRKLLLSGFFFCSQTSVLISNIYFTLTWIITQLTTLRSSKKAVGPKGRWIINKPSGTPRFSWTKTTSVKSCARQVSIISEITCRVWEKNT